MEVPTVAVFVEQTFQFLLIFKVSSQNRVQQLVEEWKQAEAEAEEKGSLQLESAEPGCWIRKTDGDGGAWFWHLRSRLRFWTLPAGASGGEEEEEEEEEEAAHGFLLPHPLEIWTFFHDLLSLAVLFGVLASPDEKILDSSGDDFWLCFRVHFLVRQWMRFMRQFR